MPLFKVGDRVRIQKEYRPDPDCGFDGEYVVRCEPLKNGEFTLEDKYGRLRVFVSGIFEVIEQKQPDPVPGKQDITELVIADLLHRNKLGIETYGRPLESHNGRNALLDTYEELLDAVKYLKQRLVEEEDSKKA